MGKNMRRKTAWGTAVCVWAAMFLASPVLDAQGPPAPPVITAVVPDLLNGQLQIIGMDFGPIPYVVTLSGFDLPIISWADQQIVVLAPALPPGSYQLRVSRDPSIGDFDRFIVTVAAAAGPSGPDGRLEQEREEASAKYHELIYAVETKHPNESRHETALRVPAPVHADDGDLKLGLGTWMSLRSATMAANLYCFQARTCQETNPVFAPFQDRPIVTSTLQTGLSAGAVWALWQTRKGAPRLVRRVAWGLVAAQAVVLVHDVRVARR
jgi:hypothetical protein